MSRDSFLSAAVVAAQLGVSLMVRVMASDQLLAELGQLNDVVELFDRVGNRIATIVPSSAPPTAEEYAFAKTLFTDEDIAKAEAEVGGVTTQQLLAGLRA